MWGRWSILDVALESSSVWSDIAVRVAAWSVATWTSAGSTPRAARSPHLRRNCRSARRQLAKSALPNLPPSLVLVQESSDYYELKLVPKNGRFEKRVNYIVVKLDKERHLLHSLEVDGKSGVNSLFQIEITELNPELSEDTFSVYEPF